MKGKKKSPALQSLFAKYGRQKREREATDLRV